MIFTGGWVCDGLRMLDLFDGQVNKYSKVLAPKATLTRIWVKSVRYKDQECTEKYGLNLIFKGIVLTPKQEINDTFQEMLPCWFSHLCQATQLTKGELWAAVKRHGRRRLSTTGVPTVLHLFYHATGWFVWIPNWQSSTFDILKAPACTTRWLKPSGFPTPTFSSGGSAELHDACLEAMRSKAFLFRFHFQDLHLLGLKPFSCDPNHTWIYPGFQHFNEWEWKNLITNSICRQVTTYPKLTSKNVDICPKKQTMHLSGCLIPEYSETPKSQDPDLSILQHLQNTKALSCPAPPAHLRGHQGVPLRQPVP